MENTSVLVLNSSYEPLRIVNWKDAFDLWFREKVEIIKEYSDIIVRTVSKSFKCPAVIRHLTYQRFERSSKSLRFNRLNVYTRDNFRCQYCGRMPGVKNLTKDHVVPRSQSGPTIWENITTACVTCNRIKADRTPEEAGMPLLSKPHKPNFSTYNKFKIQNGDIPFEWNKFLEGIIK